MDGMGIDNILVARFGKEHRIFMGRRAESCSSKSL